MDNFYRENILDHFQNPRNFGHLDKPGLVNEEENTLCGDRIRMEIKIKLKTIEDIRFEGEGCAISMASASMLTEKVKGMNIIEVKNLNTKDILELLGIALTPIRLKCALLPLEALQRALPGGKKPPPCQE